MTIRHLRDKEMQAHIESEAIDGALLDHLAACESCAARLDRLGATLRLLDRLEVFEPPPAIEQGVVARLFPRRTPAGFRVPAWARAFAPIVLFASSAFFYGVLSLVGLIGDKTIRWALGSDPSLRRLVADGVSGFFIGLLRAVRELVEAASVADALGRAALLVGETPEVRALFVACTGFFVFLALGWGTRALLSRNKGGDLHALVV
ncbi:MAG: hypothetical protein FJY73_12825 [Candidatus Eisenbacteria bacterium]|nr:hypothetical protein [Candidatus Eisenbacteria bacterium]